jgi:hypothetical protein
MAKRKAARVSGRKAASSRGNARRTAGAKSKTAARKGAARKAAKKTARNSAAASARKTAPKGSARKQTTRKAARKATSRKATSRKATQKATARKATPRKAPARKAPAKPAVRRAAPAARNAAAPRTLPARKAPGLDRARRIVRDDDVVQAPPSSLDLDRNASAARTGRRELAERFSAHNETSPALTGGDIDADWEGAYASGDEAPGGDNPTPDQDIVDDIGKAVGNEYQDNEELKGADKIIKRDKHRWELDPASAEDYDDRE